MEWPGEGTEGSRVEGLYLSEEAGAQFVKLTAGTLKAKPVT